MAPEFDYDKLPEDQAIEIANSIARDNLEKSNAFYPVGKVKEGFYAKYGKKVIAFSGVVTDDAVLCNQHGVDAFFPILRKITTLDEALEVKNAEKNLFDTATQVFRLIFSINKEK